MFHVIENMVENCRFNLDLPVKQIQLFLCATSEYNISQVNDEHSRRGGGLSGKHVTATGNHREEEGSCCRCRKSLTHYNTASSSKSAPALAVILFPDGMLSTNCHHKNKPLSSIEIDPSLWHHNELIVKDKRVLVMHKLPQVGRLVYATNLSLDLLWQLAIDSHFPPLVSMQRLYLYASHGLVWLSSAQGCLLLDQEDRRKHGFIAYPKYERQLPELESLDENTSPYAQTGFSIWDMMVVKNQILIVHDIERCAPVVHDWIQF